MVAVAFVVTGLLMIAGTYQSWPLPLAVAFTIVMLGIAVRLAVTDVGPRSGEESPDPPSLRTSLVFLAVFVVIATLQGAFALVVGHHWTAGAWLVLASSLAYGSARLARGARTEG